MLDDDDHDDTSMLHFSRGIFVYFYELLAACLTDRLPD
jgi:hypothetical protein